MSLIRRIELTLLGLFAVLMLATVFAYSFTVLSSYNQIERKFEEQHLDRARAAFDSELDLLEFFVSDFSSWDVTYQYMASRDPAYLEYLEDGTLEYQQINLVMLLGEENDIAYQQFRGLQQSSISKFVDPSWRQVHLIQAKHDWGDLGVVKTADGPILLSVLKVLKSNDEGPSRGRFVMGRIVDDALIERLATLTHENVQLDAAQPEIQGSSVFSDAIVRRDFDSEIVVAIPTIDDHGQYTLSFSVPREISAQSRFTFVAFLLAMFGMLCLILFAIRRLLHSQVVSGLEKLGEQIAGVSERDVLPEPIVLETSTELARLASEFNAMVKRLETDRKLRNEAVERLEQSVEQAVRAEELASLGSYVWNWHQKRMQSCSDAYARLRGYSDARQLMASGQDDAELKFIHDEDRGRYRKVKREAAANDPGFAVTYRIRTREGLCRHVKEVCEFERDSAGQVNLSWATCQDVSDSVRLEKEVRDAQKLKLMGRLTGGIAHDFNNLLLVMLGNIELAKVRLDETSKGQKQLDESIRAGRKAASLIEKLLAYAQRQPMRKQLLDVKATLQNMRKMMAETLGESITVDIADCEGDDWFTLTDTAQFDSAILNIAMNAADAMPQGGTIAFDISLRAPNQPSPAGTDFICIEVRDTGIGMSEEVAQSAFDPFFTTKDIGKGSGLGLSMVFGFARQCDGHVEIDSEPGIGTAIRLYLPRSPVESSTQPTSTGDHRLGENQSVLLVEDEPTVRLLAESLFHALGFHTIVAGNADEGRRVIDSGEPFDLLFSDVVMQGEMNGIDLAMYARTTRPNTPILLTSGHTGRKDHIDEFVLLSKPYSLDDLAASIQEAVAHVAVS